MHKMYPESYFERTYISKIDALRRNFFAEYFGITKKAALSELIALGIQHFQAGLVNKDLEARLNPEIQEQHAVKFRKYKAIRHYGRLLGWDLKKLSLFLRPKK